MWGPLRGLIARVGLSGIGMRLFLVILALAFIWVAAIVVMGLVISDSPTNLRD